MAIGELMVRQQQYELDTEARIALHDYLTERFTKEQRARSATPSSGLARSVVGDGA